jgi:hypothetical protein
MRRIQRQVAQQQPPPLRDTCAQSDASPRPPARSQMGSGSTRWADPLLLAAVAADPPAVVVVAYSPPEHNQSRAHCTAPKDR